jgi:hypothetical protein
MTRYLLVAALTACLPAKVTSEGPTISLAANPTSGFAIDDNDSMPSLEIETDTGNYDFTLVVNVEFGATVTEGKEASLGYRYSPVNKLSGSLTAPATTLSEADFTADTSSEGTHRRQFTSKQMFSIPGAMAGGTVTFHMEATDDEGLSSNIIDFTAMLRP